MELKSINGKDIKSPNSVLIEPQWNWNTATQVSQIYTYLVLIEPQWNWNEGVSDLLQSADMF